MYCNMFRLLYLFSIIYFFSLFPHPNLFADMEIGILYESIRE